MAIADEEALTLPLKAQITIGKKIFTVVRFEDMNGLRVPVLEDAAGERLSCILYVAHIAHLYFPPAPAPAPEEAPETPEAVGSTDAPDEPFELS